MNGKSEDRLYTHFVIICWPSLFNVPLCARWVLLMHDFVPQTILKILLVKSIDSSADSIHHAETNTNPTN